MRQGPPPPRILIADDDLGVSAALTRLLSLDCDIVGCVATLGTMWEATAQRRPDVILLDFSLIAGLSVSEVCRRLKTIVPEVRVVALTAYDDPDLRRSAYEAGCSGFVWKLQAPGELLHVIQTTLDDTDRSSADETA